VQAVEMGMEIEWGCGCGWGDERADSRLGKEEENDGEGTGKTLGLGPLYLAYASAGGPFLPVPVHVPCSIPSSASPAHILSPHSPSLNPYSCPGEESLLNTHLAGSRQTSEPDRGALLAQELGALGGGDGAWVLVKWSEGGVRCHREVGGAGGGR
jgi:hypothetical protein